MNIHVNDKLFSDIKLIYLFFVAPRFVIGQKHN